jgi:hypothetical protein
MYERDRHTFMLYWKHGETKGAVAMPFYVKRLPNEPIVIVECVPPFERQGVDDTNHLVYLATKDIRTRVFRISDVRLLNVTFESIQETLAEHQGKQPGSITDPRMIPVFVGGGELSHILADGFQYQEYGGTEVVLFSDLDMALAHIRQRIAASEF